MVGLADESFRRRHLDRADDFHALLVINHDDFEILQVVGRGGPAGSVENARQILFANRLRGIVRSAARVPLPHDVEQVSQVSASRRSCLQAVVANLESIRPA